MRILMIAPYITSKTHLALMRNQTGFGYMVHDIAQYVGKKVYVDMFLVSTMTSSMDLDEFHIMGQSWGSWVKGIHYNNMRSAVRFLRKYRLPIMDRIRVIFYFISVGQIEKLLKKYDIVHIHGCGAITDAVIDICKRNSKPFVVTLHGLNGFEESVRLHPSLKRQEKDFLVEAFNNDYPVTFISTGIKNTAEKYASSQGLRTKNKEQSPFSVVCNGCDVTVKECTSDVRNEYRIPSDAFVFAYVGNISKNKNQFQVARAYCELPIDLQQKVHVLFVGRFKEGDALYKYIENNKLQGHLHLCGVVEKTNVHNYYYSSNATVVVSKSEGFGLSIIEGYTNGIPGLMFKDMAAVDDLFDENCLVAVANRSDKELAKGMQLVMSKSWNKVYIKHNCQKFSLEQMSDKYIAVYNSVLG